MQILRGLTIFSVDLTDIRSRERILKPLVSSLRPAIDCSVTQHISDTVVMTMFDDTSTSTFTVELVIVIVHIKYLEDKCLSLPNLFTHVSIIN